MASSACRFCSFFGPAAEATAIPANTVPVNTFHVDMKGTLALVLLLLMHRR